MIQKYKSSVTKMLSVISFYNSPLPPHMHMFDPFADKLIKHLVLTASCSVWCYTGSAFCELLVDYTGDLYIMKDVSCSYLRHFWAVHVGTDLHYMHDGFALTLRLSTYQVFPCDSHCGSLSPNHVWTSMGTVHHLGDTNKWLGNVAAISQKLLTI